MTPMHNRNFKLAHYTTNVWRAVVPVGTTEEDLLDPMFWVNVRGGSVITQFDKIDVISEDGELDAELRVIGLGPQAVITRILRSNQGGTERRHEPRAEAPLPGEPRTEFTPSDKWRVIDANGEVVQKGLASFEEAEDALKAHLTLVNARAA